MTMNDAGKKQRIEMMFDNIAPRYDALNHLMSLGIDRGWRWKMVGMVRDAFAGCRGRESEPHKSALEILDVATGTGDLAAALAKRIPAARITGVDISENMLALGREKVIRRGLDGRVVLQTGDAEALGFDSGAFDCVTVAFGVRNFGDIPAALGEMYRVLGPGGRCFVLEFSEPTVPVFGPVFRFYFHRVMPLVGRLVSRDRAAYRYLPRSVDAFPGPERFSEMLRRAGFVSVRAKRLTFGVAHIYKAEK